MEPRQIVQERLQAPHILAEMLRLSMSRSSASQREFLAALEGIAASMREMLQEAGLIGRVAVNHAELWSEMKGSRIAFVDGGMAAISALGTEPVAVRIGSYSVTPGEKEATRESFRMEKQLVAELFDIDSGNSMFDDLFEDPSKLRDVARFCLEAAAALQRVRSHPKPKYLFMHGALVNPVSAYSDEKFPSFSAKGLEILGVTGRRTGRDAAFVSVYLELLMALKVSGVNVASVVERPSNSSLVAKTLLSGALGRSSVSPGMSQMNEIKELQKDYRIPDVVLFHAILDEGEYVEPVALDRNVAEKRPRYSADIIDRYPMPHVTYIGTGAYSQPLRIEFFESPPSGYHDCMRLVLHSCRLMPRYAFPAGLDIADKFAKVPAWMSRPINTTMAVELMKRALDTGDARVIDAAKRTLCGNKCDWLYRPTFHD